MKLGVLLPVIVGSSQFFWEGGCFNKRKVTAVFCSHTPSRDSRVLPADENQLGQINEARHSGRATLAADSSNTFSRMPTLD